MKIIIAILLLFPINAFSQTAIELNKQGYELFQKGKYEESLKLFEASFKKDPKYHVAHYNYACAMAQKYKKNVCEGGLSAALEHLKIAVSLNSKYKETIPDDKDFDPIRNYYDFQLILGLNPIITEDVIKILQNVYWYTGPDGAEGPLMGIIFKEKNVVEVWFHDWNESDYNSRIICYGYYTVYKNEFIINLENKITLRKEFEDYIQESFPGKQYYKGILNNGKLKIDGFKFELTDWDGSCSA